MFWYSIVYLHFTSGCLPCRFPVISVVHVHITTCHKHISLVSTFFTLICTPSVLFLLLSPSSQSMIPIVHRGISIFVLSSAKISHMSIRTGTVSITYTSTKFICAPPRHTQSITFLSVSPIELPLDFSGSTFHTYPDPRCPLPQLFQSIFLLLAFCLLPHFQAVKVYTLVVAVLTAVGAVHVVAVPTARWRSTVTTVCCRRSVHCRSGRSVAMNHDRSYRRHWFYSLDQSRGRRGIRYSFGCFSRIKKMLGRIDTRTRDRIYCQTIRTVRDISRDDRARIATCSLRTPTDLRRIIV